MKIATTLFLTIILTFFCKTINAQENPFMDMAGKKYVEYSGDFYETQETFSRRLHDTIEARKLIRQIEEVARKTGKVEWKLYASFFELEMLDLKRKLYGDNLFPVEESLKMAFKLLEEAEKWKVMPIELKVRRRIIHHYRHIIKNYELAFEHLNLQAERLEKISLEDFPEKLAYMLDHADTRYRIRDYPEAIYLYGKMLEEKDNFHTPNARQHARNGLGLSYRNGYNDLDRSDSCFRLILLPENLNQKDGSLSNIWSGIAEGNLGYNMLLRDEYDKAIPLLKSSLEKTIEDRDYAFSTGNAVNLANIYLKKGDLAEAKRYLDLAQYCYKMQRRDGMLPRIYELLGKYYASTGNAKLSMAYIDTMLVESKKYEEQFNALQMLRAEQRANLSEQRLNAEKLNAEKIRNTGYKRSLIITVAALLLIGGILMHLYVLYRKKQAAYHELVRKSQQWAQVPDSDLLIEQKDTDKLNENVAQNGLPDEADFLLMKEIEKLMQEDKLYRDTSLSVNMLAQKLGTKRPYVSIAINHCTKKNFNTFINEYRIKEAIQLLSKKDANKFTIDAIAFDVGFNNRINFYRIFKKMTGLSPVEFRKNVG